MKVSQSRINDHGATMLEFSLVIGVVLIFIFGIIDISLYFHAQNTVREVARRISKQAVIDNDFALDTRSSISPLINPSTEIKSKVSRSRQNIIDQAINVARASILASNFNQKVYKYIYSDDGYKLPTNNNIELTALLLRPGEKAKYVKGSNNVVIIHPNCVPGDPNAALCIQYLKKPGADAWNFMQRNFPYYVEVKADVNTILFGDLELKAQSIAWKDITKTSSKSDYAPVPIPLTCSEAYPNPQQLCTSKCGAPDSCEFYPGNLVTQGCYTCKTCNNFTSADQVCSSCGGAGGDDDQECIFNPQESNAALCGGCKDKLTTCDTRTNAETLCASCGGVNGNTTQECIFNPNQQIPVSGNTNQCGGCGYRECNEIYPYSGVINDDIAIIIPECACNYENQNCVFNGNNNYGQGCFGCVNKTCNQKYTAEEIQEYCSQYEAQNPGKECVFYGSSTGQCFGSRFKTCAERINQGSVDVGQICSQCNPNSETCIHAPPGSRNASCAYCRSKTCSESGVTAPEVCGECGYGTTCNFNPNAPVGNCGSCQACPAVQCNESDGLELDATGCGCKSCVPTECPNPTDIISGCKCIPQTPF